VLAQPPGGGGRLRARGFRGHRLRRGLIGAQRGRKQPATRDHERRNDAAQYQAQRITHVYIPQNATTGCATTAPEH